MISLLAIIFRLQYKFFIFLAHCLFSHHKAYDFENFFSLQRFIKYQLHVSPVRPERTAANVFSSPSLEQFFGCVWLLNGKKMQICLKVVLYSPFFVLFMCDPFTARCFVSFGTLVPLSAFRMMEKNYYMFEICEIGFTLERFWTGETPCND